MRIRRMAHDVGHAISATAVSRVQDQSLQLVHQHCAGELGSPLSINLAVCTGHDA